MSKQDHDIIKFLILLIFKNYIMMRLLELYASEYANIPNESYGVKRNLSFFYNLVYFNLE